MAQLLIVALLLLSGCAKTDTTEESQINIPIPNRVVTSEQARCFAQQAFGALLTLNSEETDAPMTRAATTRGGNIEVAEVITLSSNGIPALHIINFEGHCGFMAISADKTQANPMVMFSDLDNFELSMLDDDSPLAFYLNEKVKIISESISQANNEEIDDYAKWEYLGDVVINEDGEEIHTTIELVSVASLEDDVRLDVLEQRQVEFPETRARYRYSKGLSYISPGSVYSLKWGQKDGYNADAPMPNYYAAGCAAVAIGQLCHFHKFPSQYPYSSMPYSLSYTTVSNPISRMLRDIGDKIPGYVWGISTGASDPAIKAALKTLGYSTAELLDYNFYCTYANMSIGYPVLLTAYGIAEGKAAGHVWLCNGYQEFVWKITKTTKFLGITVKTETWYEYADYLYMNWGWYGKGNAWVDQEDWKSQHPTSGEITWNSTRKGFYYLIPPNSNTAPKTRD